MPLDDRQRIRSPPRPHRRLTRPLAPIKFAVPAQRGFAITGSEAPVAVSQAEQTNRPIPIRVRTINGRFAIFCDGAEEEINDISIPATH